MKKRLTAIVLGITGLMGVSVMAQSTMTNVIPFPKEYDTQSSGASSYNGIGNVKNSPYFPVLDYYNMKSTDTLTLLPNYKTYQQTTESTCGPAAALTVLHHFNEKSYEELEIAEIMQTHKDRNFSNKVQEGVADERGEYGTSTSGMVHFFESIGWNAESSLTMADETGYSFSTPEDFRDYTIEMLKNNTPIMVENIDFGGHWRVIIGYDTMGTETIADDVLIMADSYDTSDHMQDGYNTISMERFYYMWYDSHILPENQKYQQFLVATPNNK
nr:C39 family peptidase [uncultured Niameybacter sp.]